MSSDVYIRTYHVKHKRDFTNFLNEGFFIANYAVRNKSNKKLLTTRLVNIEYFKKFNKKITLHSDINNQILRKYGRGNIKKVSNINLVVPNTDRKKTLKNGDIKKYNNIKFNNGIITITPLKLSFRWNPGKEFEKINQIEISNYKFMITATFKNNEIKQKYNDVIGIDLNCGVGRFIANACDCKTGKVLNLGKKGPNIRKMYYKKRKKQRIKNNKEQRIMRDLDHKISRKIVNYALKNKLKIVVEDLKGIRTGAKKGKGSKAGNRFVNSWSFYRLQKFIEYKSKELGIPFIKVKPHYTSQECCNCGVIGKRDKEVFICKNKKCNKYNLKRHSDVNAGFNIGKRAL